MSGRQAIDGLIQSSLQDEFMTLEWIPYSGFTSIELSQNVTGQAIICRRKLKDELMLLLLGNDERCTPEFVSEFAKTYSLPTRSFLHRTQPNNRFRRYTPWLESRNRLIKGFTEYEGNYYMTADIHFLHFYSRYGFCSACGILRCSPVWCICGYKELTDGWTSDNERLDEFIKKTQIQTNSANEAYLEWIPSDFITRFPSGVPLKNLPTLETTQLIPLELANETDDSYYDRLCSEHPDILIKTIWITTGFTYDANEQKYYLIKQSHQPIMSYLVNGICLACTKGLERMRPEFCYECKAPQPPDWTTGNNSLDAFIMESWRNMDTYEGIYLRWIEYLQLVNVREAPLLRHGCTHIADWFDPRANQLVKVLFKMIVDGNNGQTFDFYELTKDYPDILTPANKWVIGIAQEPSTRAYLLVFYNAVPMHMIWYRVRQLCTEMWLMMYDDLKEIEEIGSGGYGTVYRAICKNLGGYLPGKPDYAVIKRFKNFDQMPELFISEFGNYAKLKCPSSDFLRMYAVLEDRQPPFVREYMIAVQYANDGDLWSYLDRNINKLTWIMKLRCLKDIADRLNIIHEAGVVHCNLHGGNIVFHKSNTNPSKPFICDLGFSELQVSTPKPAIRGVMPFIAPEVFDTRRFTLESDIYAFGIIIYLVASGEPPFRDRSFDGNLLCDILEGLRPVMPDSAPEAYKKLAERCCDVDPIKRPACKELNLCIDDLIEEIRWGTSDKNIWDAIYYTDVVPLSHHEKENKYSSKVLLTRDSSPTEV